MAFHSPSPPPTDGLNFHPSLAATTTGNKRYAAMIVGAIFMVFFFFFLLIGTKSPVIIVLTLILIVFYCGFIYTISRRFSCQRHRFPLIPLDALPVFEYKAQSFKDVLECAICLSEFQENEKGRFLPNCAHSFHVDCIDMWLHSHSTCPICRTEVEPKQRVIENSAIAQDSHKGKQAVIKRKPQNKSPFTSGMSSTPETAIDLPSRSESFTSRSEDNVK